jgi:hypothetical protein
MPGRPLFRLGSCRRNADLLENLATQRNRTFGAVWLMTTDLVPFASSPAILRACGLEHRLVHAGFRLSQCHSWLYLFSYERPP